MTDTTETASLDEKSFWLRLIPMIIFAISFWLALHLLLLIAAIQFIWVAINDEPNSHLSEFGDSLSSWMKNAAAFLSYRTEDKPFPWSAWPDADPEDELTSEPVAQAEPKATKPRAKPKTTRKPRAKPKPKSE